MSADDWEPLGRLFADLFKNRTKHELYEAATRHQFLLYPSANSADTLANEQLQSRGFWHDVDHPALDRTIRFPGPIVQGDAPIPAQTHPAPTLGQHNHEVFADLGSPRARMNGASAPDSDADTKPLAGIKVADFGWFMVGPQTIKPFSDFGADVIRVESTARLDALRLVGPFQDDVPDPERCGEFAQVRTGARALNIDLGTERAWPSPAGSSNGPTSSSTTSPPAPWSAWAWAMTPCASSTRISSCSAAADRGSTGRTPTARAAADTTPPLAGFNELTGWPDGEPGYLSAYTDFIAPRFNIPLLLAALDHRRRTGEGRYFDQSQYEAGVHWLTPSILDYTVNNRVANRNANRQPDAAPHGAYRCAADRWCVIAVTNDDQWRALCRTMQMPALADDPKFATLQDRKANEDELDRIVEAWTCQHDADKVMHLLQSHAVPAGVVQNGQDVLERDPQLRHRNFYQRLEHPALGEYRAPRPPSASPKPPANSNEPAWLGEDTHEVLTQTLGYTNKEIEHFALAGALH